MSSFTRLHRWINGSFRCTKCGKNYHILTFGYGECICPNCYQGEIPLIHLDNTYLLNRILQRLSNQQTITKKIIEYDLTLLQPPEQNLPEIIK